MLRLRFIQEDAHDGGLCLWGVEWLLSVPALPVTVAFGAVTGKARPYKVCWGCGASTRFGNDVVERGVTSEFDCAVGTPVVCALENRVPPASSGIPFPYKLVAVDVLDHASPALALAYTGGKLNVDLFMLLMASRVIQCSLEALNEAS